MRKRVLFIALLAGLCIYSSAQNSDISTESITQDTLFFDSVTARESVVSPLPVAVKADDSGDFVKDDFNLYGIVALIVAFCSLVVSFVTWIAQSKTEKHTRNVPFEDQQSKFKDLSRFCYNNTSRALSAAMLFFDKSNRKGNSFIAYPSEALLKQMEILPEDIILSVDSQDVAAISNIRNLLRSNNIAIEATINHMTRKGIYKSIIYSDLHNLLYRPFYIITRTYDLEMKMLDRNPRNKKSLPSWGDGFLEDRLRARTISAFFEAFLWDLTSIEHCVINNNEKIALFSKVSQDGINDSFLHDIELSVHRLLGESESYTTCYFSDFFFSNDMSHRAQDSLNEIDRMYLVYSFSSTMGLLLDEIKSILKDRLNLYKVIPRMVLISAAINTDRISMINYE